MNSSTITRSVSVPIKLPIYSKSKMQRHRGNLISTKPIKSSVCESFLTNAGFHNVCRIADSLQGFVFSAELISERVIIKQVTKSLYVHQLAIDHNTGEMFSVDENIAKEAEIMKIIKNKSENIGNAVKSMVGIIDFFQSKNALYLVMENGGSSFHDFIVDVHRKIHCKQLKIITWRKYIKCLLWQLCVYLQWLHSIGCCHLDISMENLLISGAKWSQDVNGYYILNINAICIKLCDFGLAEIFNKVKELKNKGFHNQSKIDFACSKYCGKMQYISPEIASHQKSYQANKSDIYSLGVIFFAMVVGYMPYESPNLKTDKCYQYIANGQLYQLLHAWKRLTFLSKHMLHLMTNLMDFNEAKRYNIEQVINHRWFNDISTVQTP